MKLSAPQTALLARVVDAGGEWVSTGINVSSRTLDSLVKAGLVTYRRRKVWHQIGTPPFSYSTFEYTVSLVHHA